MPMEERLVGVTVVLGVCPPERRRVANALPADLRIDAAAETALGMREALRAAADDASRPERVVLQCSSAVLPHDLIALFASEAMPGRLVLAAIVVVVDAEHLLSDLRGHRAARRTWAGSDEERPLAAIAVEQIEHGDAVVVANWRRLGRSRIGTVLTLLAHLNPAAQLSMFRSGRTWSRRIAEARRIHGQTAGWVHLLNGRFAPHMSGFGLTAFRYEHVRPLHPERLLLLLESGFEHLYGQLLRSVGPCRIASRAETTAKWDQVGEVISFHP